ncbi:MAG: DUF4330 family protein [Ruminococcaceae bacterium]|nr:DUF4330 family protein [Oscillospiraceae bacterium]
MEKTKKKRINALDVLIVLVILLAIAAFFLRGKILAFFEEEATCVVTYSFVATDLEKEHAAYLQSGEILLNASGAKNGEVLSVTKTPATDPHLLADGHTVQVQNGELDASGTVSAVGYEVDGFIYLADGTKLVPGGSITVYTGDAVFTLQITGVRITTENRAN